MSRSEHVALDELAFVAGLGLLGNVYSLARPSCHLEEVAAVDDEADEDIVMSGRVRVGNGLVNGFWGEPASYLRRNLITLAINQQGLLSCASLLQLLNSIRRVAPFPCSLL